MNKQVLKANQLSDYYNLCITYQRRNRYFRKGPLWLVCAICLTVAILLIAILFPDLSWAQTEVASKSYRYSERELASRSYERYEVKPRTTKSSPVPIRFLLEGAFPKEKQLHCHPLPKGFAAGNIWLTPTGASSFMNVWLAQSATPSRPETCITSGPKLPAASATVRNPLPDSATTTQR